MNEFGPSHENKLANIEARQRIAHELMTYTAERSDVALSQVTVEATLERFEDDALGAAVALDITHAMAEELALDGIPRDEEIYPVDELVHILTTNGLAGTPIDQIAEYLRIDLSLGALHGIAELRDMLSDASLGYIAELRTVFNKEGVFMQEERDNATEAALAFYEDDEADEVVMAERKKARKPSAKRLEVATSDGDVFDIS